MTSDDSKTDKHEKARALTEQALDKLVAGDEPAADALVDQAKRLDPSGAREVVNDLEEDAAARGETVEQGNAGSSRASGVGSERGSHQTHTRHRS